MAWFTVLMQVGLSSTLVDVAGFSGTAVGVLYKSGLNQMAPTGFPLLSERFPCGRTLNGFQQTGSSLRQGTICVEAGRNPFVRIRLNGSPNICPKRLGLRASPRGVSATAFNGKGHGPRSKFGTEVWH